MMFRHSNDSLEYLSIPRACMSRSGSDGEIDQHSSSFPLVFILDVVDVLRVKEQLSCFIFCCKRRNIFHTLPCAVFAPNFLSWRLYFLLSTCLGPFRFELPGTIQCLSIYRFLTNYVALKQTRWGLMKEGGPSGICMGYEPVFYPYVCFRSI